MSWNPWPKTDEKDLARFVLPDVAGKVRIHPDDGRSAAELHAAGEYSTLARHIYESLCRSDIRWSRAPYHPESKSQVVRHPEAILHGSGEGTCLDLALLFAGALLGHGLLPLVVVLEGHALVAVSLTTERSKSDSSRREQSIEDGGEGSWWVDSGVLTEQEELKRLVDSSRYELVECTGFSRTADAVPSSFPEGQGRVGGFLPWERAVVAGREQLDVIARPFRFAVDPGFLQDVQKIRTHHLNPYMTGPDQNAARRLLKSSDRLFDDLTRQIAGPTADHGRLPEAATSMYVRRECQDELTRKVMTPGSRPQILTGEAGHGKSSLLWDLARELTSTRQAKALLVSSSWLSSTGHERPLFDIPEIIESARSLRASHSSVVILLDTADLLLHNENAIHRTHELIESLSELNAGVVVAVRPQEQLVLRETLGEVTTLGAFSPAERDRAVTALMKRHFPQYPDEQGLELVRQAVARGLAAVEICESPFLLKMLFELAGDVLPSMEIDVTGLYHRYWERRIKADSRGIPGERSKDLTALAGHTGIAMLAEGTPEPHNFPLELAINQIRQHVRGDLDSDAGDNLLTLVQRGVLIRADERTRFMHQTLFEYCAAMGLARRGGVRELERLVGIAFDHPEDFFIGAVLEQLLVILGTQPSSRHVVTCELNRLMTSRSDALKQVGLLSWVHHPDVAAQIGTAITTLPSAALVRFVRIVPRVWGMNVGELRVALGLVWNREESNCKHEVIRTLGRLARSQPDATAALVRELDCIDYFVTKGRATLSNPKQLFDLIFALATADPDMVGQAILRLLPAVDYPESRILLINRVAENWEAIGSPSLHDAIVEMLRQQQTKNGDDRGRSIREALGAVLFAFWSTSENQEGTDNEALWITKAASVCGSLVVEPSDVAAGAGLFALARYLCSDELTEDQIRRVLEQVWAIRDLQAQRKLVSNLLAPLLIENGLARELLITKLAELLDHLPVAPNADRLSVDESWASIARSVLEDERLSPGVVRAVASKMTLRSEALWLSRDFLVSLISPAVLGKVRSAQEALEQISSDPDVLRPADQTKFLNESIRHASKHPALTAAYVAVATHRVDTGAISVAVQDPSLAQAFIQERSRLSGFVHALLNGSDGDQRQALNLWSRLQKAQVLNVALEELTQVMPTLRDPIAKAMVLSMVPLSVSARPADFNSAVKFLEIFVAVENGTTMTPPLASRASKPEILDAAAAALRQILAEHGSRSSWPVLRDLIAAPKHTGKQPHEASVFVSGNRFIQRSFNAKDCGFAVRRFAELGGLMTMLGFSGAQIKAASNCLYSSAQLLIRESTADDLELLIRALPYQPRPLGEVISRLSLHLRRTTARPLFEELLAYGLIDHIADYVSHNLRSNFPEVVGGALPDLLEPA